MTRRNGRGIMTNRLQKTPCSQNIGSWTLAFKRRRLILVIKRRNVSIQPRGLIVENGATRLDSCYYRTALRISRPDRNTYSFSSPCFLSFFFSFFLPFFFIFKRKRYSYVISAREKRRFVSSTRVHPRPPFPSMPLQSPLNPSSNWKRC